MPKVLKTIWIAVVAALIAGAVAAAAQGAALPDGRGYELVSPPAKNGGQISSDSQRTRAAADGSAVGFSALSGFGDVANISVSTDYMSVRTGAAGTNGWATHALIPPQTGLPYAADTRFMEPLYFGEFSDDLSRGVLRSYSPVTDAPDVANVQNLYVRDDLRTPGLGSYQLVTACPGCSAPFPPLADPQAIGEQSFFAGASQDFGHVVFESRLPLTADSTADPSTPNLNLFEWDRGVVRLAGVLPDSACGSPPCAAPQSQAGQGASINFNTPHVISDDGSRIYFTVHTGSCPPRMTGCGDLYLRSDHATTVQLNASEKTNGTGPGGTDPGGHQVAQYCDASRDGSRAFFLSVEALTDDAPVNTDQKLYMYSVTPDAQGHHLTFVSADHEPADAAASDTVLGVMGVSDDGHTVYFVDIGGQLVSGAPLTVVGTDHKVFRWHDGTLDYVGATLVNDDLLNLNENYIAVPHEARVSPDGRSLLFSASSGAGLTHYNHGHCRDNGTPTGTCRELYLYRADATPHLVCASCNPSGAAATADALDIAYQTTGAGAATYHLNRALSDDGRRVFFSSGEALGPQDVNGSVDAYEYDAATNSVHLLSSGQDASDSFFLDASRSGDDAFFVTRQRLVGWDRDGAYDLYDARVGGGLPDPSGPVVCTVACRGPASAAPPEPAADSQSASGSNAKPHVASRRKARGCRRGFVRKRVRGRARCVKAPKRTKHGHRRTR